MNLLKTLTAVAVLAAASATGVAGTFVGDRTDFRDETIYFAITTRFYDGDPANNVCGWDRQSVQIANNDPDWRGDFKGLIDKLDYIKALGFTAVWITPVTQNCSGTDFHGYHSMDFSSVDLRYESRKEWGSEADVKFQDLIDAAHAKGMKVVLDIVLNHTSNFGEATLNPLFTRSQDIRNQASVSASIRPNPERLPSNYNDLDGNAQYAARFKYFKNPQYDTHNYYHHYGTGWNWDYPNRWWGQIAGDCVDLNTENQTVSDYLVHCYGEFIKMGVDGFRIDTTGHISRLTFNKSFIPQLHAIAHEYRAKRLNECEFFMFGECCARYSEPIYRGQHNLSSHFYTWQSPQNLLDSWNSDPAWWDAQNLPEGHDNPVGNMALCEQETAFDHRSDNVFMINGAWHEPDRSQASGFNVIDFPMHYNFNNAGAAIEIAKKGDHFYNDASYNVVYVDSHDYCPGPDDGTRFNKGTAQWAENLSLMFTFRGIPCIYYGSEVEFQKGKKVDAGGSDLPVKESGRAYFGTYLEGEVTASDFGVFTATGNAARTLDADLAQHIIRLNKIRAAVPALRKGQYTFDGCSAAGGWAFKRAYRDSYALVAINGGATFSNVPEGTYTDLVTGEKYEGGGTITVSAPKTKGQLRVLVKDWTEGRVGDDGKFIYAVEAVAHGGDVTFTDPGTTSYYTADDAPGDPAVVFSPASGSFKTDNITVTASLNDVATEGWVQVGTAARRTLAAGQTVNLTIGDDMAYGDTKTISWGASNGAEVYTGSVSYRKVDPNATITVYVTGCQNPNLYAWGKNSEGKNVEPCGAWPGKSLTETVSVDQRDFYYFTFDDMDAVNVIFNKNGQTGNIEGITDDSFFSYDGATSYSKLNITAPGVPSVRLSPNGGSFVGTVTITASLSNATAGWYQVGNGSRINLSTTPATFTLGADMADGQSVTVSWSATDGTDTRTGTAVYTKQSVTDTEYVCYFRNTPGWNTVGCWMWDAGNSNKNYTGGSWPGVALDTESVNGELLHVFRMSTSDVLKTPRIIFNNFNQGRQTADLDFVNHGIYDDKGYTGATDGIADITADKPADAIEYYNLQGVRVARPTHGLYLMRTPAGSRLVRL